MSLDPINILNSSSIFPFYDTLFMNRLEFSCFADFFVRIFKTRVEYRVLVGFGRACAHPSFRTHCHTNRGAARPPPRPSQLRCFLFDPQKIKKSTISRNKNASLQDQTRAARGVYLSTGLSCTLLSYAIPYYGKLCCILRATCTL